MTRLETILTPLPVVLPLLGAATLAALRKVLGRAGADSLAIAVSAAVLGCCASLLKISLAHTIIYWFGGWFPRGAQAVGIAFAVDPAGAGTATLAAFLSFLAAVFSWRFVDAGAGHLQPMLLVFLSAMCGFALTGDLFNMFVFFELMSTAAFALCGLQTRERAPLQGAFNFAITNTIAAFMVLTGIGLLYAVTGGLNLAQVGAALAGRHDPVVLWAAALLLCGFLIKAAVVPFHFWLADAHAVAPTPVCVLFSGIMVELGLYAVLRLHAVVFAGLNLRGVFLVLGCATVLLGGVMCYAEHHLKRMLAFSTITHAGLMLLGIAIATPTAVAGTLLYLLAHGLIKGSLFFTAGIILHRLRAVSEPKLMGQGRTLRWTALLWFLGGAGLAGAPPFGTTVGEALSSHAAEGAGLGWLKYVFLLGGFLTGAAVLRAGARVFLGWGDAPITDSAAEIDEVPETREGEERIWPYHWIPAALLSALGAALGWLPGLRAGVLEAAARLTDQAGYVHTVYGAPGLPAPAPAFPHAALTGASGRGLLALAFGALLAANSLFRLRVSRKLRLGAFLEGPLPWLRGLQSGHPGDYVLWITCGAAGVGSAFFLLLR